MKNTTIDAYACTDIGPERAVNQDAFNIARDLQLFMVADGMGGYLGGDIASQMAVDIVERELRASKPSDVRTLGEVLARALRRACKEIFERATVDAACLQMGTTATALCVSATGMAVLGHVGDSRCYLARAGSLYQLSEDHSLVGQQLRAGVITEEGARTHPFRNVITRSLGSTPDVEVDLYAFEVHEGDRLLLCSDGLCSLSNAEIHQLFADTDVHQSPARLVDAALASGATDNVTVVALAVRAIDEKREFLDPEDNDREDSETVTVCS